MNALKSFLKNYFYFAMSLLILAVVIYGFSHTIASNLLYPQIKRPFILYIHAIIFSTWVLFFIFQSALVRARKVRIHLLTGWFGLVLGLAIPVFGVWTSLAMARFRITVLHVVDVRGDITVQSFDMISFFIPFCLAMIWRKKLETHRRLILVASCVLTSAAFGRFPHVLIAPGYFYVGVDGLISLGVFRDLLIDRRVHAVYQWCLPILILSQTLIMKFAA